MRYAIALTAIAAMLASMQLNAATDTDPCLIGDVESVQPMVKQIVQAEGETQYLEAEDPCLVGG